ENALWSLGAHDVSVLLHLASEEPDELHAFGESYMRPPIEDVVFCYLRFPSGLMAHLHLSWLDPHKERRFTIVGSDKMATFDDMQLEQKLVIYDKGFDQDYSSFGEYIARSGDVWSPRISNEEPLRIECSHFAAILGKALVLARTSQAELREPDATLIGDGATIAAQVVVVAGATIGPGAFIGDQAHVRERAFIGADAAVGR